jgi:hypothetical protein
MRFRGIRITPQGDGVWKCHSTKKFSFVSVGTRGSIRKLPGLRMSKKNSGCRCVVPRIVLANESILAHRRSVMRSSKHSEPRWREAFLVTILGVVCWRTVRHGSKSGSASTSVVASIRPCASDKYTPPVRMRSRAGGDVSSCGIVGAESTKPPSSTRSASYRRDDVFNAVRADCGSQGPPGEPALRCCTQSG